MRKNLVAALLTATIAISDVKNISEKPTPKPKLSDRLGFKHTRKNKRKK